MGLPQHGFYFDQNRCTACRACVSACNSWNMILSTSLKPLRIFEWRVEGVPSQKINTLFATCYHCEKPTCIDSAGGTMYKEENYGAVLIDSNRVIGPMLRAAWESCPYGAITFDSDAPTAKAFKCTMCIDRLEGGLSPACVSACSQMALDFGPLSDLQKKYGMNRDLDGVPNSLQTKPAVVFKPLHTAQKSSSSALHHILHMKARSVDEPLEETQNI